MGRQIIFMIASLATLASAQTLSNMNGTSGPATMFVDGIVATSNEVQRDDLDILSVTAVAGLSGGAVYHVLATPIPPGHAWVPSASGLYGIYSSGMPHPWGTITARTASLGSAGIATETIQIPLGLDIWCDIVLQVVVAHPGVNVVGIPIPGFTMISSAATVVR